MRVLTIGQSGQMAQALVERAAVRGVDLTAMGRPALDICDDASVRRAIEAARPDIVINAAAYTAVDAAEDEREAAFAVNAAGAERVAAEAARIGAPIVQLSTDYVFDGEKGASYQEDDAVAPAGVYGASKLDGERRAAAANPRHLILRLAWIYSPFGRNFAATMLRLAAERDEIGVVADQIGAPAYALDIADALLDICSRAGEGGWGVFHLAAGGACSWADFAEAVFQASALAGGPTARVKRIATADYPTAARRPAYSKLDSDKLHRCYGVALPHWSEPVSRCIERLVVEKELRA